MAKFQGRTVGPGSPSVDLADNVPQSTVLSDLIARQVEGQQTGTLEEEVAAAAPAPVAPPVEAAPVEAPQGSVATEFSDQAVDEAQQIERERIPAPQERLADKERVDKFYINDQAYKRDNDRSSDGGIRKRAQALSQNWQTGRLEVGITPRFDEIYQGPIEGVGPKAQQDLAGTAAAAFASLGAAKYAQTDTGRVTVESVDPGLLELGSLATENFFADGISETDSEADVDFDQPTSEYELARQLAEEAKQEQKDVARNYNNVKLGQQIFRDYKRMQQAQQGVTAGDYKEATPQEANAIGTIFKELYARNNPDLIEEIQTEDGQKYFRVTPKGGDVFEASKNFRSKMFPKPKVRPAKTPQLRQKGEGRQYTKETAGALNRPVGDKILREAADNLGKVPNVVNPQRMRILFATALPALLSNDFNDPLMRTFSEINNFGSGKLSKMKAVADSDQEALQAYNLLKSKIAQEIYGVASERNGANYLTYYLQAFNGRLSPQQTHFDPTASKTVRFVTTNATPVAINPGSRQENNLRQMYAMMLVKGADMKLPDVREQMLTGQSDRMEQWGDRLAQVLDQSMTDEQAQAVAEAIEKGVPLNSPEFPQINPLALDPNQDAELLRAIEEKGEDGPHFIDGLIDFAKYNKARKAGRPYQSFFNAYVDGKTNGLAANGIQMGSHEVAYKTGVLRDGDVDLLDDGDLRDTMQESLVGPEGWLNTVGFTGTHKEHALDLNYIADVLWRQRPLHKATTMTFGYGKDIAGFIFDIDDTLAELAQLSSEGNLTWKDNDGNQHTDTGRFASVLERLNSEIPPISMVGSPVGQVMKGPYGEQLTQLMSKEAMSARGAMRQAAIFSAMMFEPMKVKTYTGYVQEFGGKVSTGYEGADVGRFDIREGGERAAQPTIADYKLRATAAAPRIKPDGSEEIGGKAYGGAIPGPVQSLDAATVALTVTGKSWDKMKAASGGKTPYIHTIYDAFKSDANSYDVMLDEVNNNWLKAAEEWSYLEATRDGYEQSYKEWKERYKDVDDKALTTEIEPGVDLGIMVKELATKYTNMHGMEANKVKDALRKFFPQPPKSDEKAYKAYWQYLDMWSEKIMSDMEKAGYSYHADADGDEYPPMTMGQYKTFIESFYKHSRMRERFSKLISETNNKKKKLVSDIRKSGKPNYQYYAH